MNKEELVNNVLTELVYCELGSKKVTKKDVEAIVNLTIKCMGDALESGDRVSIVGFGTLEPVERSERKGKPFGSKTEVITPAHMTAVFHPGKLLKEKLQKLVGKGF